MTSTTILLGIMAGAALGWTVMEAGLRRRRTNGAPQAGRGGVANAICADGERGVAGWADRAVSRRRADTRIRFEVYRDAAGAWRWRLRAGNGEIVAHHEGYTRRRDAIRAVRWMQTRPIGTASVYDVSGEEPAEVEGAGGARTE